MLDFLHIDPLFDRRSLLDSAKEKTWLVADLEHKKWLQDVFFEKESWLSEDRVLRANELWLKIPHVYGQLYKAVVAKTEY